MLREFATNRGCRIFKHAMLPGEDSPALVGQFLFLITRRHYPSLSTSDYSGNIGTDTILGFGHTPHYFAFELHRLSSQDKIQQLAYEALEETGQFLFSDGIENLALDISQCLVKDLGLSFTAPLSNPNLSRILIVVEIDQTWASDLFGDSANNMKESDTDGKAIISGFTESSDGDLPLIQDSVTNTEADHDEGIESTWMDLTGEELLRAEPSDMEVSSYQDSDSNSDEEVETDEEGAAMSSLMTLLGIPAVVSTSAESSNNEEVETDDEEAAMSSLVTLLGLPAVLRSIESGNNEEVDETDDDYGIVSSLINVLGVSTSYEPSSMAQANDIKEPFDLAQVPRLDGFQRCNGREVRGAGLCAICLEEFTDEIEACRTPCSHIFHGRCITQWLWRKGSCPTCRFKLC